MDDRRPPLDSPKSHPDPQALPRVHPAVGPLQSKPGRSLPHPISGPTKCSLHTVGPGRAKETCLMLDHPKSSFHPRPTTLCAPSAPGRFVLATPMRSCPCSHRWDPHRPCSCAPWGLDRYGAPVEELFLDLGHLHVEDRSVMVEMKSRYGETSQEVAGRVLCARGRQLERSPGGAQRLPSTFEPPRVLPAGPERAEALGHGVREAGPAGAVPGDHLAGRPDGCGSLRE